MQKTGQAAMEFLMTYGWAILVVLAAIAALAYFGVLSPGKILPEQCTFQSGLSCIDKPAIDATNDRIELGMKNNLGGAVHITTLTATSGCTVTGRGVSVNGGAFSDPTTVPVNVANNDNLIVRWTCSEDFQAGDRVSAELVVTYRTNETGLSHNLGGTASGSAN